MHVLIVDDSRSHRGCIRRALPEGWQAREATNGAEALEQLDGWVPDLMFLDLNMPVKTGYEVLEELKGQDSAPPVFVVSADIQPEAQERVRSAGAAAFLKKPFDRETLLSALSQYGFAA